ncbi:RDD family protein [Lacunisphaera limnophila]|uniref:RDD family protein n=1 Tax=Lacunisphaera limnophila TaxID=1838286 RepID=A0A1D8ASD3_9BACT|nr:RDD family protein [Lacunisphaera limnophila]AOS43804.1 RDD family protein [Lacunisphaera limnophila]
MKTVRHLSSFLFLLLTLGLTLGPVTHAQENTPAPVALESPHAPAEAPATPPLPAEPESTAAPEAGTAEVADAPVAAEGEMRELGSTEGQEPAVAEEQDSDSEQQHSRRRQGNERVSFGSDSILAAGDEAEAVISILGSSTSAGKVQEAVVSVLGSSRVTGGTVGDSVVSVMGNTYVNGHVQGEVVAVLGNIELGPEAIVDGEMVCVGGQITRDPKAVVRGNVQNIAVAGRHFDFSALTTWFTECVLYARPLAFHRDLFWAWMVAAGFLGFYVLIALLAPGGVVKCAETLEQRPGSSLLAALLTLLLTPVAYILLALLCFIAIGFVLIPVFSLGLFLAAIFGKIVMLAWLGRRFTKLLGDGPLAHPVFGVLIGGTIVLGLYTVPVLGFITYKLLGILGLGVVVYTIIRQIEASRPPKPVAVPAPAARDQMVAGLAGSTEAMPPPVSAAPPVISAVTLPRAGFWIRIAATLLDVVLVGILFGLLEGMLGWLFSFGGAFPLWFAVYNVAMWATKGTTIGGIVCGLKVVRLDDRPLDWSVAVVRALGAFLSLAVAGLGFIWVAFDDEKQSWHDKIAGTTIVKVPKGTALL